ncbi:MAG: hypothetical protein ACKO1K_11520 [Burkholderiales bacterium]
MQDLISRSVRSLSAARLTEQLKVFAPVRERAIIINCSTKLVTTLALMSALRYAGMPVLLIDCDSTDGSQAWFRGLAAQHEFDLAFAPLRSHGETLDQIFAASRDDSIMLIDSDLEILQDDLLPKLRAEMAAPSCYGAGFLHTDRTQNLGPAHASARGRYADRMWIPLCFLKTASVRQALNAGATFRHSRDYLEFPWSMSLSRWLYARHRVPFLGAISLEGFAKARQRIYGERAAFREYDTGARIHEALVRQGRHLAHLGEPYWSQSVRHYHGVTRATLSEGQENATAPGAILAEVAERLRAGYGMVVA